MQPHEIENWVLKIIDRVKSGQPIEDSRVELKTNWIDPEKAARQIAGHANSARGSQIIWLIGVDESNGVVGADYEELANWNSKIRAQFDGLAPSLTDINVPHNNKTIAALLFETNRAPYVVKNPKHGQTGCGSVSLEVPWREGTSTRSARREDLIKILSPLQILPDFEVLAGSLTVTNKEDKIKWNLSIELYANTTYLDPIFIPFHKCSASIEIPGIFNKTSLTEITLKAPKSSRSLSRGGPRVSETNSLTIDSTSHEIMISGPGILYLVASASTEPNKNPLHKPVRIEIVLSPLSIDENITLRRILNPKIPPRTGVAYDWLYEGD